MIEELEKQLPLSRPVPLVLDMGLGSREQGFRRQRPELKPVPTK